MRMKQPLGEILISMAAIQPTQLKAALERQHALGHRLGRCLTDLRVCTERTVVAALGLQYGLETVVLSKRSMPPSLRRLLPASVARETKAVPLQIVNGSVLRVAMARPWDLGLLERLREVTGLKVRAVIAGDLDISGALQRIYGRPGIDPVPSWDELTLDGGDEDSES